MKEFSVLSGSDSGSGNGNGNGFNSGFYAFQGMYLNIESIFQLIQTLLFKNL